MIYIIPLVISGHTFQIVIYDLVGFVVFVFFFFFISGDRNEAKRVGGSEFVGRKKQAVWPRTEDGGWNGGGEGERCRR